MFGGARVCPRAMKTKISPTVVGLFVIGAFVLGIIALLTFGGVNFFSKPQRFLVYFNESIHGLDLGSPVKLQGVRVGRVVALNVRYEERTNESVVAVLCELSKDVMTNSQGVVIDVASRAELQALVDRGMRAQLGVLGLATGLLYVELDFKNPREFPADPKVADPRYAVVPAVQSTIAGLYAGASEILGNLRRIDFAGLARNISALVADTRKQIDGLDLKGVTEQWKKTGAQVETLVNSPEIVKTFANLNLAATDLRATIAKLDGQIEPTSQELAETLAETKRTMQAFNSAAAVAESFISTHAGLGAEVTTTLSHLGEAADAVKRLADFLERNPNALITGRKRP
jgi:paraquat-inducible protein B